MIRKCLLISMLLCLCIVHGSAIEAAGGENASSYGGEWTAFGIADIATEQSSIRQLGSSQEVCLRVTTSLVRPVRIRFEGIVSKITPIPGTTDEDWIVAGVPVKITNDTLIIPRGYQVIVGDWVRVKAILTADGSAVAESVNVYLGPISAFPIEFRGRIEDIKTMADSSTRLRDELQLMIDGTTVIVDENTVVQGQLIIGYVAGVGGELLADGGVLARRIVSTSPDIVATTVEFENIIAEMDEEWWLVGEVKVWIAGAEIEGAPFVGLKAEVRGLEREDDGSVEASYIRIERPSPSEEVRLSGHVVSISQDRWVIETVAGNQVVYVGTSTFVDESRAPALIGNLGYVLAEQHLDGSLFALRIRLERSG